MAETARQTNETWTRIENWLAHHAPRMSAALCPPAPEATLRRVEHLTGTDLPPDLAAWWRRRHGLRQPSGPGALFPDSCHPLPLDDALRHQAVFLETPRRICPDTLLDDLEAFLERCAHDPAGTTYPHEATAVWLPAWIPVAHDTGGAGLFADLRPGPRRGCLIRYSRDGHAAEPAWPSLAALLTHVADHLEAGVRTPLGHWTVPGP
ncbi:hypothetical protein SRB5_06790 [Streptomyces sp. RB5]|uniref:Knr4/Smi1-like domain-containing protein n=1 Tax=Streptomyces smaragdinus TaxID=2585196 RepID=A0A7K0CAX5_9ACTN|nr:SMI1/KNR4 family protein [Streptomyces smaragdinus]MQY10568.1 hypothetical protein [Streptomyces smaragdinus]